MSFESAQKKVADKSTMRVNHKFFVTKQSEPKTNATNENDTPGVNLRFGNFPIYPTTENHSFSKEAVAACSLKTTPRACPFGSACHACPTKIQEKLAINEPGDVYEQEADRVAERAMRTSSSLGGIISSFHDKKQIKHKCVVCEMKKEKEEDHKQLNIRRRLSTASSLEDSEEIADEIHNIRLSGGVALDTSTKNFMESRLDYDFGGVRIHTDEKAARSADSVNALAYTVGNDVMFGPGQYQPSTLQGRRLLAHELTHVVQQGFTSGLSPTRLEAGFFPERISRVDPHIQREILTYNSEQLELEPNYYSESTATVYDVYSAESFNLKNALQTLIVSGKIGTNDTGERTFFYNKNTSRAEALTAFTIASLSNASELTDALMDNHNVFVYSQTKVTKISDLLGTSTLSTSTRVMERQTRRLLTNFEKNEAKLVYGSNLDLDRIMVEEDPVMSVGGYARTTYWTINFPLGALGTGNFMPFLIHELGHSWQYQHGYSILTTIYYAIKGVYDYGGETELVARHSAGKGLSSFNTEQQADIARDYYERLKSGKSVAAWLPFINEFKGIP